MKAAYTRYGPPDVVEVSVLDKPVPRHNEVLIRVRGFRQRTQLENNDRRPVHPAASDTISSF